MVEISQEQLDAVNKMKNGSILCGNVGSGKSRTALLYYVKECGGEVCINGKGKYKPLKNKRKLYVITTAKKRDSAEWLKECAPFRIVDVVVDSWNNIKKYKGVIGEFFIFDEQRVVGSGAWVKAFLDITRKNKWILLSATPGDQWSDYIPVFVANGFYRNKTEFITRHVIYKSFSKYPQIDRYIDEGLLMKHRQDILVPIVDRRLTTRHNILVNVDFDLNKYKMVMKDRWDPYENKPIQETGKLMYLLRKVVNSDESRLVKLEEIINDKKKVIIFYNYEFECVLLRSLCERIGIKYGEWNGNNHDDLPSGEMWAYLVQYTAGCEGWNCITTDTIIFYSQSYSYRQTEQASGRIDRMNTPYKDLYYYKFISYAPIDRAIKRALANKRNFNENMFIKEEKIG